MEYYIGQIFVGGYPEGASEWCNVNNCYIDEVSGEPERTFVIKAVPDTPPPKLVRTFAKDAIWVATRNMLLPDGRNVWNTFKEFLIGANLWEGWNQQAYLLEENPFYVEFYPQAVAAFGQELVDSVLAASVVSTRRADV